MSNTTYPYFYTDEQGRHRFRHDENYQILYYFMEEQRQSSDGLRPGKGFIRGLVPWEMLDSWSMDVACQAIIFGTDYDLDHEIDFHMKEGKAFTAFFDIGDVTWKVRHRFLEIAKSAFAIGKLKDPDTPKNWIKWARENGYSVDHLEATTPPHGLTNDVSITGGNGGSVSIKGGDGGINGNGGSVNIKGGDGGINGNGGSVNIKGGDGGGVMVENASTQPAMVKETADPPPRATVFKEESISFPGRSSIMPAVKIEMERRAKTDPPEIEPTITEESKTLAEWAKLKYPGVQTPTAKAISNGLRGYYKELKGGTRNP